MIETLLPIAAAFAIVAISPGPANIAAATIAMRFGRRSSLAFGLGLGVGLAFWGLVAATGMGAVLQSSVYALTVLKVIGAAYLLWLAVQSAKAASSRTQKKIAVSASNNWFWRGLLLNLSNPKAVLAWMAALSMGLGAQTAGTASTGDGTMLLITATVVCMVLGFANYMLYATAFSLHWMMDGYTRFARWIEGGVAALFAMAGFGLLRSALQR